MTPPEEPDRRASEVRDVRVRELTAEELLGPLNDVESKHAPPRLYASGRLELPLSHPRVAIVGTRQPSPEGVEAARAIVESLVREGVIIVSGLARGIDTAAHTSTIRMHGRTIAVLGTPLDKVYPKENASLQDLIGREHVLVSQYPPAYPIRPGNFILRNRTMALVADASVIVESSDTGGSLSQGWEALRLGRPLFLWKSLADNPALRWPREMMKYGAIELSRPEDVLEVLPSARFPEVVDAPA